MPDIKTHNGGKNEEMERKSKKEDLGVDITGEEKEVEDWEEKKSCKKVGSLTSTPKTAFKRKKDDSVLNSGIVEGKERSRKRRK